MLAFASSRTTCVLAATLSLLAGCGGASPPRAAPPPQAPATDELLALAPAGTELAVVASARGLALLDAARAHVDAIADGLPAARQAVQRGEAALAELLGVPGLPRLADLGLDPAGGVALFVMADGHAISVWPVADRAAFVAALHGERSPVADLLRVGQREWQCAPVAMRYVCADEPRLFGRLGTGSLAGKPARSGARGDLELVQLEPATGDQAPRELVVSVALDPGQLVVRLWADTALEGPLATLAEARVATDGTGASGLFGLAMPSRSRELFGERGLLREVLHTVRGPVTAIAYAGTSSFDARIPLASTEFVRALVASCVAPPSLPGVQLARDGDGCRVTTVDDPPFAATFRLEGDTLRATPPGGVLGEARGPGPTAWGREPTTGPWTAMLWGRGSELGPATPASSDPDAVVAAGALRLLTELGAGVRFEPQGVAAMLVVRTAFANPRPIVDELARLTAPMLRGEEVTAAISALAAAHPGSPLADDVAAGPIGLRLPMVGLGVVAGLIAPAVIAATERSEDDVAAIEAESATLDARPEVSTSSEVKHILLAWKGLGWSTSERSQAEAARLARSLRRQVARDPSRIDALMAEYSEDPASAKFGRAYPVTPDAGLVEPFKRAGLRLNLHEVTGVETDFGYHVLLRVPPTPPDPLASTDILARTPETGTVHIQHILIGWKDSPAQAAGMDPRAAARTKAEADTLATELLAKVRAGQDMTALMKAHSEDPGSNDDGRSYPVRPGPSPVAGFVDLSLRLHLGEAGLVKTNMGWHVILRVPPPPVPPPPPPDKLDSRKILARAPVTARAQVKHILLGWKEVNAGDARGAARTRPELERLVRATVARLKKGAKVEALMKELSEDPGSAATGEGYQVTPDASLVEPFKDLSLRLKVGEVGVIKSQFGIHIIVRIE